MANKFDELLDQFSREEKKTRRQSALVIKIADEGYLSEHNNIVDFNHARIIKSPGLADKLAKSFNDKTMKSIDMKYDLEFELVDVEYKAKGTYKKFKDRD